MPETFYQMKNRLNFRLIAGGVKALHDLAALRDLNIEERDAYEAALKFEGSDTAYRACLKMAQMHDEDAQIIQSFMTERGL